mmetsp:Transcript_25337/g.69981  ORF Transcript_25337/g.69981 Transcript_25337/m.69981 type:complete len:216 (-) Transcript_25337:9-656(-)
MSHFGVELQAPHFGFRIFNGHKLGIFRGRDKFETVGHLLNFIPVRHPHLKFLRHPLKQNGITALCAMDHGFSILVLGPWFHRSSKYVGHFLHTVANSQDGNLALLDQIPRGLRNVRSILVVHRGGAARQDNGSDFVLGQFRGLDLARIQFAVHMQFAHSAGNQVRVLRSKIQNGNLGTSQVAERRCLLEIFLGHGGKRKDEKVCLSSTSDFGWCF